jgi:23S rRNA-/tRNA-specific pseudouridylate synthase
MDAASWRERGVDVVYRDASLLVLGKPSGLPTTSPNAREDTLVKAAEALDPDAPRLHPSSRLDAEVSGLVTFARTPEATRYLLDAREQGLYRRAYVGLVAHPPVVDEGELDGAIGMDPRDPRKRRVVPASELNARPSRTRFRVLARAPHAALLWLEPITGRTHQLRVHLAHEGSPLLGDRPYGGLPRVVLDDGSAFSARRVMLHCYALRLPALRAMGVDQPARAFERAPLEDLEKLASAALGIELKPLLAGVLAAW